MIKPTKRKAFNFLRSYFDVLNELENDKDKLNFLMSIINKQFLDQDPGKLNFIVNLCYESQRHQIESSVKGWKRASNDTLGIDPSTPLGTTPPTNPKEEEEKEKEKEEEKEESINVSFGVFWDLYGKKKGSKDSCEKKWNKLKDVERVKIIETLPDFKASVKEIQYLPFPETYLNQKRWNDELEIKPIQKPKKNMSYAELMELEK